jgi:F-type H+-transporting ATPase subunit b
MEMTQDPVFWVAVSFVLFFFLSGKTLWKLITSGLDKRSADIKAELEEAMRLRAEAQEILATYQKKQKDALNEAERILQQTKADAQLMAEKAEAELRDSLEKRKNLAMTRIAQAEAKAVQAVQQHVVDIAVSAARVVVSEHIASGYGAELLKLATTDVEKKLH